MSVYVKGVEMPDDCRDCPFEAYYNSCGITKCCATGKAMAVNWRCIPWEGRAEWCPLVDVPTPHGRLIDEAIVLEMIRKSLGIKDLSFLYNAEKSIVNEIYHASTVIEAEDE